MDNKWIIAADFKPANSGAPYKRYLVAHPNRLNHKKTWTGIQYWVDDKWDMEGITHWMPLPEPPEGL